MTTIQNAENSESNVDDIIAANREVDRIKLENAELRGQIIALNHL